MLEEFNRRSSDSKKYDIESMIAEENDPKQRSFLIVLNSINNSLVANTVATSGLSVKFDEHLSKFEKKVEEDAQLLNQGKGAWKVAAWVLGSAQAILISLATFASNDLSSIHRSMADAKSALVAAQIVDARIESRVEKLEDRLSR
jgi:hypothetical protein